MAIDIKRLNSWLNSSKTQTTNNPLWQLLKAVIGFVQENSDDITKLHSTIPIEGSDPNTVLHGATEPLFRQVATGDIENAAITTGKIVDGGVTYAKIQDVSAVSRLLGRGSAAGVGDVQEIVLGTNLSMSGTTLNSSAGAAATDYTNTFMFMGA